MSKAFVLAALLALVTVPVSAQTLAEASAKAKADRAAGQQWPASANAVPVFDPVTAAASTAAAAEFVQATEATALLTTTTAATTTTTATTGMNTETYWKTRMRGLITKTADDQASLAAAVLVERALNTQANRSIVDHDAIRDRRKLAVVENQWQDAVKDVSRLTAVVKNDVRAKADLELEAHRAGVPAGWLILE